MQTNVNSYQGVLNLSTPEVQDVTRLELGDCATDFIGSAHPNGCLER